MILRFVSMRQGMPFSMRVIVIGETSAARASSALLINLASLVSFKQFWFIDPHFPMLSISDLMYADLQNQESFIFYNCIHTSEFKSR